MELGFRHRPLEAKKQPIIEVGGVVEAVLIQDKGIGEGADLKQPVPIRGAAGQAGDLEAEHYPHLAQADGGHELLEAFAVAIFSREPQVAIDDHDALGRPAQSDRSFPKRILSLGALRVFKDLPKRALANVEIGKPPKVARPHLEMVFEVHVKHLLWLVRAISAKSCTSSALIPTDPVTACEPGSGLIVAFGGFGGSRGGQADIQLERPPCRNTANPRGVKGGSSPRAWARRAS